MKERWKMMKQNPTILNRVKLKIQEMILQKIKDQSIL